MSQEKATVTLSTRSWHYKLVKFILGSATPTPDNMHNLCPYFWLMVFSILVFPVWAPIKGIYLLVNYLSDSFMNWVMGSMITPVALTWEEKLSDLDAYQIWQNDMSISKSYKKAFGDDNYIDSDEFVLEWWKKKYGKEPLKDGSSRYNRSYTASFNNWRDEQSEALNELRKLESQRAYEKRVAKIEYEEKMSDFRDGIDRFFDRISEAVSSWKNIIKWTKRIVGLIVTLAGLVATYFVVNFVSRGVLYLVEHWNWMVVAGTGAGLVAIGIIVLIVILMKNWIRYMQEKGTDLWYVKGLYYLAYAIYWPFKIVFYHLVWQLLLVNLWFLLVKAAKGVWKAILNFLGIFGEYFGASYTDYCPGIDWEENK